MKLVPLIQIVDNMSCAYGDEVGANEITLSVAKVSNIDAAGNFHNDFELRSFTKSQAKRLVCKNGDLLVVKSSGSKTNVLSGKTAICGKEHDGRLVSSNFLIRLRPKKDLAAPKYLWHFLNSQLSKEFVLKVVGTTTYPNLKWSTYSEHPIPLPPLAEQERISSILDKADAIRRKRQAAIKLADDFLRATFLDMFGDPLTNSRKWVMMPLESFCSDIVDCPHSTPIYSNDETSFPCIRSSDLQDGHLFLENTKYVSLDVYLDRISRIKPESGDIIYCREGARLGNLAIVPEGLTPCLGQRTMLFRTNRHEASPNFLLTLLNSDGIKNIVFGKIIGAAAPRVNVKDLKELCIIKPPVELQKNYELIALKHRRIRQQSQEHLNLGSRTFQSLTQRAFQGEL